jgi:hypothetical protein
MCESVNSEGKQGSRLADVDQKKKGGKVEGPS